MPSLPAPAPSPTPDPTPAAPRAQPDLAARLRGFGPLGLLAFLVVLLATLYSALFGALAALVWAWVSRTPWRELGFVRPKSWARTVLGGVVIGVAFKLAMKSLVMPLLGAPAMNQHYHYLEGNTGAIPGMILAVLIGAGFGEEVLMRGYLFERLGRLLGRSAAATTAIVLITSALFAAAHYPEQGMPGVQQAAVTGLVIATLYARTRTLPFVLLVHAAFDLTALVLIYNGLETRVAHWFFR